MVQGGWLEKSTGQNWGSLDPISYNFGHMKMIPRENLLFMTLQTTFMFASRANFFRKSFFMVKHYRSFYLNPTFGGQLPKTITCSMFMIWKSLKFHDQIQDFYFNFYVWSKFKFNLKIHVPRGNIIGHFGPIPLNKWFSSTSKMHNSFMPNPDHDNFVTKLNILEIYTTLIRELFPF